MTEIDLKGYIAYNVSNRDNWYNILGYIACMAQKSLRNQKIGKSSRSFKALVTLRGKIPAVIDLGPEASTWETGPEQPHCDEPSSDVYFTQLQVWWK